MTQKFPFAFDMNAFKDAFTAPKFDRLPAFDFTSVQDMQQKNVAALMEANKAAMDGYKAIFERQVELFDSALAQTKDRLGEVQGQPITVETAEANYETLKVAVEKAVSDVKELTEMAQAANSGAFDILKTRAEEAIAEIKTATDKLAA